MESLIEWQKNTRFIHHGKQKVLHKKIVNECSNKGK